MLLLWIGQSVCTYFFWALVVPRCDVPVSSYPFFLGYRVIGGNVRALCRDVLCSRRYHVCSRFAIWYTSHLHYLTPSVHALALFSSPSFIPSLTRIALTSRSLHSSMHPSIHSTPFHSAPTTYSRPILYRICFSARLRLTAFIVCIIRNHLRSLFTH